MPSVHRASAPPHADRAERLLLRTATGCGSKAVIEAQTWRMNHWFSSQSHRHASSTQREPGALQRLAHKSPRAAIAYDCDGGERAALRFASFLRIAITSSSLT